jgi:hypothetical protein
VALGLIGGLHMSRAASILDVGAGHAANRVTWLQADLRSHNFARRYELWHDHCVLQ